MLLIICVGVFWMWVMVNKVRGAMWDKRNIDRQAKQEDMELVETDDKCGTRASLLEAVEDTIEIV